MIRKGVYIMSDFTSTVLAYYKFTDGHIFDDINIPAGIDKDILINVILTNAGEFEPLWTNVYFYKDAIDLFFNKWYRTFEKWANAINSDYEPLYNYDRYEDIEEKHDNKVISDMSTSTNKSAFNANTYKPYDKVDSDSDTNDNGTFERKAHLYGNIGVTTSSALLKEYLDISEWNLYNHISDIFISEMCIAVY